MPKNVCMNVCMVAWKVTQKFIFLHISCIIVNIWLELQRPKKTKESSKIKDSLKLLDFFMCINITGEEGVEPSRKVLKTQ